MSKFELSPFGELDIDNIEEYYDGKIEFNGREISVDLTIESGSADQSKLKKVQAFLSNLAGLEKTAIIAIQEDYKSGDTVKDYIEHHLAEIDEEEIDVLLEGANKKFSKAEQLLSIVKLKRLGFNTDNEGRFISMDYTIDEDLTDYLIVVDLTETGKVDYITMES